MEAMPLLEYVKSFYPSVSLKNTLLIGCPHLLEDTHSLLRSFYDFELKPKNIHFIGKCYSSSQSVWQEMRQDGIQASPQSFFFDSHKSFDEQFAQDTAQFMEYISTHVDMSQCNKIIIMDDGGNLLTAAMDVFKDYKNIVGIEQTSCGYEKIKTKALPFPVINVARCGAKLVYESPVIVQTIVQKTLERIATLKKYPRNILIIGYGAIGSAVHAALKDNYIVQVYDKKNDSSETSFDELLGRADLVIGCTGATGLPFSKYKYLKKGCSLICASSSDQEFDVVHARMKSKKAIIGCHDDIEFDGINILNCGFPINFDGARSSTPAAKIQLTIALLATAVLQASELSGRAPGIIPLDPDMEEIIIAEYLQMFPELASNKPQPDDYKIVDTNLSAEKTI